MTPTIRAILLCVLAFESALASGAAPAAGGEAKPPADVATVQHGRAWWLVGMAAVAAAALVSTRAARRRRRDDRPGRRQDLGP